MLQERKRPRHSWAGQMRQRQRFGLTEQERKENAKGKILIVKITKNQENRCKHQSHAKIKEMKQKKDLSECNKFPSEITSGVTSLRLVTIAEGQ